MQPRLLTLGTSGSPSVWSVENLKKLVVVDWDVGQE